MDQKVAVVILNYKLKKETLNCIKSVLKTDDRNLIIYLVDNNSKDGIEEEVGKLGKVVFIQAGENLGYSGGNNLGIKKALSDGADDIFVLNPDTTIRKDTIPILARKASFYNVSILSPKIYFANSHTIWYAGGKFDEANVLGTHIGVDEVDKKQFDDDKEVDFATGAAMFVSAKVFKRIGFFDERYFLYYEDSDLCFRARKAGYKIMYIADAVVYHENAKATGLGSPTQDYYITRNRMLFASKFLSLRTQFALLREALKNFNIRSKRQALMDYLIGKFGK